MSDQSARLSLPFLAPSQAQKHVTHNEALTRLDAIVQLTLEETGAETPPALPEVGQAWGLGAAPANEWAGQAGRIATFDGTGWIFVTPQPGWRAIDLSSDTLVIWDGAAWSAPALPPLNGLDGVGVMTGYDATNRLAVSSPATLLTHDGAGHQLKINKAQAGDTASLLFQTDWSGRAEMGTAGDDDFAIKVSADGSTWTTALNLTGASGVAEFPAGARIAGQDAFHRGNILGTVGESAGQPTGAVIEQGGSGDTRYVRFADGTQIVWMTAVNMGSILAAGTGTWATPYRTNPVNLTWPVAFTAVPAVSANLAPATNAGPLESRGLTLANFEPPNLTGWSYIRATRIGDSAHDMDVELTVMAVGRWF